jgi:hypothetical protein
MDTITLSSVDSIAAYLYPEKEPTAEMTDQDFNPFADFSFISILPKGEFT